MNNPLIIAVSLFVLTYLLIVTEKFNRTAVAMFGAVLMLVFHVEHQELAFDYIDLNTIFLLIGMMIIVGIMRRTGIFEYMAIWMAKLVKGDPWRIVLLFSVLTGVSSALLDNVTTILLVVPVTIVIAEALELNPIPFLIPEVLIANIGGTATLIGDPPNIMIGSATKLGFNDFLINLSPVVVITVALSLFALKFVYKAKLVSSAEKRQKIMKMDEKIAIKDKALLYKSIAVLGLTIVGFLSHQFLGYESATVALFGAGLLLLISKCDPEEVLAEVEWGTIFFFASLFILVGALEEVGVIEFLAMKLIAVTGGNMMFTVMVILWGSAIASAFLDNIPFVATMIPLIQNMGKLGGMDITPLWWALALGACLGGNGTMIGASANVIVGGLLGKYGYKLSFWDFMKVGFPIMLLSIVISSVYMVVVYL
ncbi:MAG: hypothetical protein CSA13_00345 [Clostridiales bacterium]|nr:MAG: hypothetical protein CSA13_00345 [Clostridiales bacterium]